jgi:DNA-binding CsgD family transcriptional regulator
VFLNLMTLLIGCGEANIAVLLLGSMIDDRVRAEASRLPMILSWALAVYGRALTESDERAAHDPLGEAERLASTANNPWLTGLVHHHLAQLATRQDNVERAEELHHHALAIRHGHGLRPGVAESLEALAGLAIRHQDATEAVRILAAVDQLRSDLGLARWPADQTRYDEHLKSARAQLGEAGLAAAWAEGQLLSIDEAVAYATRSRGHRRRATSGWSSLTPTENSVVELLAQGLTNPQIAERLFISRATVKTHLIHVFSKLGVSTRSQLAADATRHYSASR